MLLKNLLTWTRSNNRWWFRYAPPLGSYNYYGYSTRPWQYIEDLWLQLKWFYQRGAHGYADNSVWSIDWYLTSFMGKALRELAEQVHGVPIIDTGRVILDPNDCDCLTMEEWKATILYIADTFDLARKIEESDLPYEKMPEAMKRFHQGMTMFNEYFFNLWD
jgi:hypothetical protein